MDSSRRWLLQTALRVLKSPAYQPAAPFLYPCLTQMRNASILSNLSENKGHYNKKIRRGRGPASGKGKTAGRGIKGQKAHGKVPANFNGGQTPDHVVAGPRGGENAFSVDIAPVNLNRIQQWIDKGRLNADEPITLKELTASRCIHGIKDGVKLLARGKEELRSKINIIVSRASQEAISAVEATGGTVTTRFYTPTAIKRIMRGETDPVHSLLSKIETTGEPEQYKYRLPDPINRKEIEYYRDPAHRGYLTHTVKEGHGPSLFFKDPALRAARANTTKKPTDTGNAPKVAKKADAKMW